MEKTERTLDVRLLVAILLTICGFGISQSVIQWGKAAFEPQYIWPSITLFVLPVFAVCILFGLLVRWTMQGDSRGVGRRYAWIGFFLRLACAAFLPLLLFLSGVTFGLQHHGVLFVDAQAKEQIAWGVAQGKDSLVSVFMQQTLQPDGGLITLGVAIYRFFFYSIESPMALTIWMAFFSACAILIAYRLAESVVSQKVAQTAAWLVAIFPDAILFGSTFLAQGMLATFLGFWLLYCSGLLAPNPSDESVSPAPALWKYALGGMGIFFAATSFFPEYVCLFIAVFLICGFWLTDFHTRSGKLRLAGLGGILLATILLSILAAAQVIPPAWDLLGKTRQYFFDFAWLKMNSTAMTTGNDLLENIIRILPEPIGFFMIAVYGLLQPFLPAVVGSKGAWSAGSGIEIALLVIRSVAWFLVMPLIFYGILASFRLIRSNRFLPLFGVLFLLIAWTGAFRSLGDQINNPMYRMIALVPMAIGIAWTVWDLRDYSRIWFLRILIPFFVGVGGLTGWYILRSFGGVSLPSVATFIVLAVFCVVIFFALVILRIPSAGFEKAHKP
jgi:hypothetical protein